jgi:hypothetical protein
MSYQVRIDLEFDTEPSQEDVHDYLMALMGDEGGVGFEITPPIKKEIAQ